MALRQGLDQAGELMVTGLPVSRLNRLAHCLARDAGTHRTLLRASRRGAWVQSTSHRRMPVVLVLNMARQCRAGMPSAGAHAARPVFRSGRRVGGEPLGRVPAWLFRQEGALMASVELRSRARGLVVLRLVPTGAG